MYFLEDDPLGEMERLMQRIPNYLPRGHGVIVLTKHGYSDKDCDCRNCHHYTGRGRKDGCALERCICLQDRIRAGAATYRETIAETMSGIRYPPFIIRLNQYLKESEESPMNFKNEKHHMVFTEAAKKMNKKNDALMAALYLLTADQKLWNHAKRYVLQNKIRFGSIHLRGSTENGYALYCAAKDIYLGTTILTIGELADTRVIPPRIFGLICNAMAIRRFGLGALNFHQEASQ